MTDENTKLVKEIGEELFFSKSTFGFYSSKIHKSYPDDVVPVTLVEYLTVRNGLIAGRTLGVSADGKPITNENDRSHLKLAMEIETFIVKTVTNDTFKFKDVDEVSKLALFSNEYQDEAVILNKWVIDCQIRAYKIKEKELSYPDIITALADLPIPII
jgi:hypothetical protein